MKDSTREAILKEIVELVEQQPIESDEVTTSELAEQLGISVAQAYHLLKRQVDNGSLAMRHVVCEGHARCAFKRVKP